MDRNVIFFAWNRPVPGREALSSAHFKEFVGYLTGLAQSGTIQGFDTVLLDAHGGDMNGFFLIRGDAASLDAVQASAEWAEHQTRATLHLDGSGYVRGTTGEGVQARMELWNKHVLGA